MNIELQSVALLGGLPPVDAADTAAATSDWIDVRSVKDDIRFIVDVGVVTAGSITPTIEHADDDSGTNSEAVVPLEGAFTAVTTANDPLREVRHLQSNALKPFVRVVGTIDTGPVQVAYTVEGR